MYVSPGLLPNLPGSPSFSVEVYSERQRSNVVQAEPAVLHYGGYEVGKHHQQTLVSVRAGILLGLIKG